jgi:hypothetical protein
LRKSLSSRGGVGTFFFFGGDPVFFAFAISSSLTEKPI